VGSKFNLKQIAIGVWLLKNEPLEKFSATEAALNFCYLLLD
jgi:hypothetical protein